MAPPTVPESLAWWGAEPGGAAWLARLPELIESCVAGWQLELDPLYEPLSVSYVARVTRSDGTPAVLKIAPPHAESDPEGAALERWDGRGAVRLLERDHERRALLLERVVPGTQLWDVPDGDETTRRAGAVLRRLWVEPPADVPLLADVGARWLETLPADWEAAGRAYPRRVLDQAVGGLRELLDSEPEVVLLHQDGHGGNILASERGDLVIDPKPLAGERAFDLASYVRDRRDDLERASDPAADVARRLDVLVDETGVDRERARIWALVHALAWGVSGGHAYPQMTACAGWLAAL